jgi:hypothetical protein
MHGCRAGTQCPMLHAKQDEVYPIGSSDARCTGHRARRPETPEKAAMSSFASCPERSERTRDKTGDATLLEGAAHLPLGHGSQRGLQSPGYGPPSRKPPTLTASAGLNPSESCRSRR